MTWQVSPDEYTEQASHVTPPPWTRVYRPGGKMAHYQEAGGSCPVVLRFLPRDDHDYSGMQTWLGTGTQDEYEQAQRLPLCIACFATRQRYHPDLERLGSRHGTEMT